MLAAFPKLARWTVALGLLLAVPAVAHAEPEWSGDFESGDFSQWTLDPSNLGNARGVTIVQDVVFEGAYAARVEIAQADVAIGGLTRNELEYSPSPDTFEGSERYYAIALRTGEEPWANDWHSLWYWEGNPVFAPVMTLNAIGPQLQFRTFLGVEQELWNGPFVPGQWHEFVLHVFWSPDPTVGFVELYYGDEVVVPLTNVATMHAAGVPNFMHAGVLRSENIATNEVLYIDGVRSGMTLQDAVSGTGGDSGGSGDGATDTGPGGAATSGSADGGDASDGGGDASSGASAATGGPGAGQGETGSSAAAEDRAADDGCGCTTTRPPHAAWLLFLLIAPWLGRRRGILRAR